ncbi:MAG: asparagine synthase (glutamine-hydrolyzing) [Rhodospirillales bacterium]|nr:asparagine synthase (glutamine-hydrolyzing) [Alphaproteobacteria bacterium]USO04992.1 MAG: asparagine synthase (glutamine-hydrolyzing) [Rhodospirillales bacterium]
MCGITGFYTFKADRPRTELHVIGKNMADALSHRGPDAGGLWQDPDLPLVLGHRRLSIIDLSEDGAQPMISASERYVTVFNGEIYNFRTLKKDLEKHGHTFKGRSDTEVILAAIEAWGLSLALQKLSGMFAFALWDRKDRTLSFARDRLGKKPLYIGWAGANLIFGSQLEALRTHPDFIPALNPEALQAFLTLGYVEAPLSIYEQIWQLPPGHRLTLDLTALRPGENLPAQMKPYWQASSALEQAKTRPNPLNENALIDEFESLLSQCVSDRMISDVPLGAFLSGGIDSSSIVALMQKHASQPVKTYAIGFEDAGYNEAPFAAKIAAHLGTDHHEHFCTQKDALDLIPRLPEIYDEPFADISAIPTLLVSRFARESVSVALSGDGGDEMLGGYSRHVQGPQIWKNMHKMPRILRIGLSNIITRMPVNSLDQLNRKHPQLGVKLHKVADILSLSSQEDIYRRLIGKGAQGYYQKELSLPGVELSFAEKMMFWDTTGYLPHDILTKVDRASMAYGLEARAPLLDTRIFDYVWSLPENIKIRGGQGKWLLRQVLKRHVPEKLFQRPKQGFNMPVGDWLRGDLRDWAESLLDEKHLREEGLLDVQKTRKLWQSHLGAQGAHGEALWCILMFQAWHKRWM